MPACPVCSGAFHSHVFARREEALLYRCIACSHGWFSPVPSSEQLEKYYSDSPNSRHKSNIHVSMFREEFLQLNRAVIEDAQHQIESAMRYVASEIKTVLDFGCSYGLRMHAFSEIVESISGVDLDEDAVAVAANTLHLDAFVGGLADVRRSFDAISVWMVLEHLPNPELTLSMIRQRLNPGGVIIGTVPDFSGVWARAFGGKWYHIIYPEHLQYYTRESLTLLFRLQGFRILHIGTTRGLAAPSILNFGLRARIHRFASRVEQSGHNSLGSALRSLCVGLTFAKRRIIYGPISAVILRLGLRGNGMLFVAQRTDIDL